MSCEKRLECSKEKCVINCEKLLSETERKSELSLRETERLPCETSEIMRLDIKKSTQGRQKSSLEAREIDRNLYSFVYFHDFCFSFDDLTINLLVENQVFVQVFANHIPRELPIGVRNPLQLCLNFSSFISNKTVDNSITCFNYGLHDYVLNYYDFDASLLKLHQRDANWSWLTSCFQNFYNLDTLYAFRKLALSCIQFIVNYFKIFEMKLHLSNYVFSMQNVGDY